MPFFTRTSARTFVSLRLCGYTCPAARFMKEKYTWKGNDNAMESLISSLTIFVLAIFVGFEIITKVPPTLHTPLMSGSNAISGITLIGAIVSAGAQVTFVSTLLGFLAVVFASINVVGGFMVTNRMLGMFKTKQERK